METKGDPILARFPELRPDLLLRPNGQAEINRHILEALESVIKAVERLNRQMDLLREGHDF